MKNILLISLFSLNNCFSQDLQLQLFPSKLNYRTNVYSLKIFNNLNVPIGVKCSSQFKKISDQDTLQVAIGDWYNGNGTDYFYGIEQSEKESQYSESFPFYQLVILSPQTYLLTNVNLTDLNKYKNKSVRFSIFYTSELTGEEIKKYSERINGKPEMTKEEKKFLAKTIELTN